MKKIIMILVINCFCCHGQTISLINDLDRKFDSDFIIFGASDFEKYSFAFTTKDYVDILMRYHKQNEKFNKKNDQEHYDINNLSYSGIETFMNNSINDSVYVIIEDAFANVFPSRCILAKLIRKNKAVIIDNSINQIIDTEIIISYKISILNGILIRKYLVLENNKNAIFGCHCIGLRSVFFN